LVVGLLACIEADGNATATKQCNDNQEEDDEQQEINIDAT